MNSPLAEVLPVPPTAPELPLGAPVRIALVRDRGPRYRTNVRQAEDVFRMFRREVATLDREVFSAVLLDGRNSVLGVNRVSVGSLTATLVHPREVFKAAILANAAALILVHNHPSGDPTPSAEDDALTTRLRSAGELMGIKVLDHIVLTGDTYRSMAEVGRW